MSSAYDNPELGREAEQAAEQMKGPENGLKAVPVRSYLDQTVTPLLLQGMAELVKRRPDDPVEYLAAYLLKNNPHKHADS